MEQNFQTKLLVGQSLLSYESYSESKTQQLKSNFYNSFVHKVGLYYTWMGVAEWHTKRSKLFFFQMIHLFCCIEWGNNYNKNYYKPPPIPLESKK